MRLDELLLYATAAMLGLALSGCGVVEAVGDVAADVTGSIPQIHLDCAAQTSSQTFNLTCEPDTIESATTISRAPKATRTCVCGDFVCEAHR